jgi:hypothetical protein
VRLDRRNSSGCAEWNEVVMISTVHLVQRRFVSALPERLSGYLHTT